MLANATTCEQILKALKFAQSPSQENLLLFPAVTKCGLLPELLSTILEFGEQSGAGTIFVDY